MKKKVIAVLLASMMATSMVPVTAMAEDQPDVVSAEETQDLSEDTETEDQGFFEEETVRIPLFLRYVLETQENGGYDLRRYFP